MPKYFLLQKKNEKNLKKKIKIKKLSNLKKKNCKIKKKTEFSKTNFENLYFLYSTAVVFVYYGTAIWFLKRKQ